MTGFPVPLGPVGYPLPACADGGYPLLYLTERGECLCCECANNPEAFVGPAVTADCFWEGNPLECDECGDSVFSYYGPAFPEVCDDAPDGARDGYCE